MAGTSGEPGAADMSVTPAPTPEDRELEAKRDELSSLQDELVRRELELATLLARLHTFEKNYMATVGTRYVRLDEIEARLAEAQASLAPEDDEATKAVAEARARAEEPQAATERQSNEARQPNFVPGKNLKLLYRELAKRVHPDLATEREEHALRTEVMAEVNRAYASADEARLKALLVEWDARPEAVRGETVGAELVRTIRRIAQVRTRLSKIWGDLDAWTKSELYGLMLSADRAAARGRDLLAEMATRLDERIAAAQARLSEVTKAAES